MAQTKIRLIIFFAAKDGEGLYSQQKQDQELTVQGQHVLGETLSPTNFAASFICGYVHLMATWPGRFYFLSLC